VCLRRLKNNIDAQLLCAQLCAQRSSRDVAEAVHCLRKHVALSGRLAGEANDLLNDLLSRPLSDDSQDQECWKKLATVLLRVQRNADVLSSKWVHEAWRRVVERIELVRDHSRRPVEQA
jgi:hypothetical protein